jgi:hypothetical protein
MARRSRLVATELVDSITEDESRAVAKDSRDFEAASTARLAERAGVHRTRCAGDEETRRRVEAMLAADARDNLLMDRPAWEAGGRS